MTAWDKGSMPRVAFGVCATMAVLVIAACFIFGLPIGLLVMCLVTLLAVWVMFFLLHVSEERIYDCRAYGWRRRFRRFGKS